MIGKTATAADLVDHLHSLRSEASLAGIARYGIVTDAALGISNPVLRKIARAAGKDHVRAFALWDSGIREARLLALFTMEPKTLTAAAASMPPPICLSRPGCSPLSRNLPPMSGNSCAAPPLP
jgi:3-methyladenine DNA glycosylase AlkD